MAMVEQAVSKAAPDLAADAAAMLLRLGFAIFAIIIPSTTIMSRWVIVVLVPIGAMLIILSTILRGDPFRVLKSLGSSLWSIPGLTALSLAIWAVVSLFWAPNAEISGAKIARTLGVILLGLMAVAALPQRMRASNLHLVTIGVAGGALLIIATTIAEWAGLTLLRFPLATPGRASVILVCLGWAAAAWMLIRNQRIIAVLLVVLVFFATLAAPSGEAVVPLGIGFLVFALAWAIPERAGLLLAVLVSGLVLAAPVLAFVAMAIAKVQGWVPGNVIANIGLWWDLAISDPIRLMTGRGFDAVLVARERNLVPADAPGTLISDLWFDLGLLGAVGAGILLFSSFRAAGRFGYELAPLALAGLSSAFTFALVERGATQTWWLNGMIVFAVVLLSVERGRYRTIRPRASIKPERQSPA
jgi:hypothetical protein